MTLTRLTDRIASLVASRRLVSAAGTIRPARPAEVAAWRRAFAEALKAHLGRVPACLSGQELHQVAALAASIGLDAAEAAETVYTRAEQAMVSEVFSGTER